MKPLIGLMAFLMAGVAPAAELYKWVDEKGVVNYGEKPPPGRAARPVNTLPGAVIETGVPPKSPESERRPAAEMVPRSQAVELPAPAPAATVRGMEFDTYIRLQRGMTEGELLERAGQPDHQSLENMRSDIVKTYYYFPTSGNPYTTVIRLRAGRIQELDRVRKF